MREVWKYAFDPNDWPANDPGSSFEFKMPSGAQVLHAEQQDNKICIWALVEPSVESVVRRRFHIYGTGHPVLSVPLTHISTFLTDSGVFVFHVFEEELV